MLGFALAVVLGASESPSPPPAPSDWILNLLAIRYVSASGDSVALSRARGAFKQPEFSGDVRPPRVSVNASRGLVDVCFNPSDPAVEGQCAYEIFARTADAGVPAAALPSTRDDKKI